MPGEELDHHSSNKRGTAATAAVPATSSATGPVGASRAPVRGLGDHEERARSSERLGRRRARRAPWVRPLGACETDRGAYVESDRGAVEASRVDVSDATMTYHRSAISRAGPLLCSSKDSICVSG